VNIVPAAANEPFLPGVELKAAYPDIHDHQKLWDLALKCDRCRLRETCQQVVFCDGPWTSKIMFVGEGPGKMRIFRDVLLWDGPGSFWTRYWRRLALTAGRFT